MFMFSLALMITLKIINFVFPSSQWTPTRLPSRSMAPCWFPSAVLLRCPSPCCRWRIPTVHLTGWSSSSFRAQVTDGWSCSVGRKDRREGAEERLAETWPGMTSSPGRSWEPAGFGSNTKKTKPGQWLWCGFGRMFRETEKERKFTQKHPKTFKNELAMMFGVK